MMIRIVIKDDIFADCSYLGSVEFCKDDITGYIEATYHDASGYEYDLYYRVYDINGKDNKLCYIQNGYGIKNAEKVFNQIEQLLQTITEKCGLSEVSDLGFSGNLEIEVFDNEYWLMINNNRSYNLDIWTIENAVKDYKEVMA